MTANLRMLTAVLALAALGDAANDKRAKMTPEEFAANRAEIRRREAAYAAQRQREYDAIAQPYRDARRARKAAQLAREQRS
jgi:hypothetical protein